MRLYLWQRLFLALAVLSGAALFGFAAWQQQSFRRGFLGYLDEMALQRLAPAKTRLAAAYSEHGNWDFLRGDPAGFGELIEPFSARSSNARPPMQDDRPPPPEDRGEGFVSPHDDRPPPDIRMGRPERNPTDFGHPESGRAEPGRAEPGRPRPHPPSDLMPRVVLLDAAGDRVTGNPRVPPDASALSIMLDEQRIGTLLLAPMPQLSGATDLAFEQSQLRSALVAGIAILIGALLLAFALARWLLAPVRALATGTQALAAGDYTQRIATHRGDELGALSRDFNHLATTLEQHRSARQQWGADIAHELRTPLSILRGEIQAMQDGVRALTPQALESLQVECERLGHLIEDLYQLALADAGALDYRFESLDLAEIVREALDLQRPACTDARLIIEEIIANMPRVRGDARRLAQLLDNLLANARHYTDSPGRIRVTLTVLAAHARLVIEDTAPGVPTSALPRLFERLYRMEDSRNRAAGGAGLGLAICRAIVDAHGGRIDALTSDLGGLRVVVDLPAEKT
jgi:two-component system, OmpR family, sensor histidine kinase BaeS